MFIGEIGGWREERMGRKRAARGLEECERGGERGQLRKASSCAPSTLILSGLFAWGTHSASTPSDLLQSPLLSTLYLQRAQEAIRCLGFHLLCPQTPKLRGGNARERCTDRHTRAFRHTGSKDPGQER